MKELYYYFWSLIRDFGYWPRMLTVVGILTLLLYLFLKITYPIWKRFFWFIYLGLNRVYYLCLSDCIFDLLIKKYNDKNKDSSGIKAKQNIFSDKCREREEKIKTGLALTKKKHFSSGWGVIIYFAFIFSIYVPDTIENTPKALSAISDFYIQIEADGINGSYLRVPPMPQLTHTESQALENSSEITFTAFKLNSNGKNGSNLRSEPNGSAPVIRVLEGSDTFYLIEKDESEKWYRVRLEDQTEGWINRKLVEEVSDGS